MKIKEIKDILKRKFKIDWQVWKTKFEGEVKNTIEAEIDVPYPFLEEDKKVRLGYIIDDIDKIHNHPNMELEKNIDKDHVIIDKEFYDKLKEE